MTNNTSIAICNKGIIARKIALSTTCRLGTLETNLNGRRTRKARRALTSNAWTLIRESTVLIILFKRKILNIKRFWFLEGFWSKNFWFKFWLLKILEKFWFKKILNFNEFWFLEKFWFPRNSDFKKFCFLKNSDF